MIGQMTSAREGTI